MNTSKNIIDLLNSDASFDAGLSMRDAHLVGDCVNFTYPAPVLGGLCCGVIRIYDDGRIFDDTSETTFANFDAWLADFNALIEENA